MAASADGNKPSPPPPGTPSADTAGEAVDPAHACSVLKQLRTMYEEGQLTDIVVEVDRGKAFSCHRNVLAAISPYFRSMFTSGLTESSQKEVRIVGVEAESMELVLKYAYTSRVVLTEANVQALFTAASIFQIPSIQDQCAKYMISHLDPQNSIGVFIFADHYGHQELGYRSKEYIRKKFLCVTKEQEFLQLTKDQLISILDSDDLNVDREEHVYESIVRWFEYEQNEREVHLPEIFAKCIRFPLMEDTFIEKIPPQFAQAIAKSYVEKGPSNTNGCTQRLGMTASEMIICFDAAHKHSGKKQTVPCLDIVTGRVFKLCKPPNDLREVGILISPDNDIYIAGGYRPSSSEVSIDHKAENDFWMYDHSTNRWLSKPSLLRARIGCKLVYCCGKMYAIGGRVYEGDGRNSLKSVECYDSRENCWTTVCAMPVAMEFHNAVEYKEKIYVLQGRCLSGLVLHERVAGEFFLFYEPQKDYWGFLTPMTVPRIQGLAAVYKDSIYYIAGTCGNHQRMFTVEAYDIELNKWTRKKDFPCDESINPYLKLVLFQNKLHLFVRATQVTVEEHVFRTSRKNSLYQYDDITDQWMKVYETPDRLWDLGRHFECAVAKLYPQCLQKVL
ncbi:PREDICTED: kelch repeat and BTB domain-containing protein 8 isoform X3 [Myotis brandtii]|uniref:kelch repeat and BTB domain-containing protein 8 isoform X3 n=1 Tax=Myotis brandtii TaxID=109478 RepID=UPI0003BBE617|nr:PREDICTED: kelch repeat and BTB domain-containing protein 8 isoform X3 [Myotis brandtii]